MRKSTKNTRRINDCWNAIGVWSNAEEKCNELDVHIHCRNCPKFAETGRIVFERAAPSGYLTEWRDAISAYESHEAEKQKNIFVFRVGCEWFALPSSVLSEVATERVIHRIPRNTNRFISGVVNINGEVKICYTIADLLDMNITGNEKCKSRRMIVVELSGVHYVFLVDEVKGLHWYCESDLLPVPATLSEKDSAQLYGIVRQFDQKIAIFDVENFQKKLEGSLL